MARVAANDQQRRLRRAEELKARLRASWSLRFSHQTGYYLPKGHHTKRISQLRGIPEMMELMRAQGYSGGEVAARAENGGRKARNQGTPSDSEEEWQDSDSDGGGARQQGAPLAPAVVANGSHATDDAPSVEQVGLAAWEALKAENARLREQLAAALASNHSSTLMHYVQSLQARVQHLEGVVQMFSSEEEAPSPSMAAVPPTGQQSHQPAPQGQSMAMGSLGQQLGSGVGGSLMREDSLMLALNAATEDTSFMQLLMS